MKIEHLAIWVVDLEETRKFYEKYFAGVSGERYHNPAKNFTSYFLSFNDSCRLELMHKPDIASYNSKEQVGIAHFAFSLGSKEAVDELTRKMRQDGFEIVGEPRLTGDGYYESVIKDPEGNRIELTI